MPRTTSSRLIPGAVAILALLAAGTARPLVAQDTTAAAAGTPLSLGDAARLGAHNAATAETARLRVNEARARVTQRRADLMPSLYGTGAEIRRTMNTASFGIAFPTAPGQPPLFDPNGQVVPPFNNIDFRGHLVAPLFDFGALARLRAANADVTASSASATVASEQAGTQAALAYVQVLRAEDTYRARAADSALAADLVTIAQAQLQAGTGVALDVTRAQSQLAATRADLIVSRAARDRAHIQFERAINVPVGTTIAMTGSLAQLDTTGIVMNEADAVRQALARRPDLVAAQARLAAARSAVTAIRAERLPTLSLIGDDGVNGLTYSHLLNTYAYGVQISLPVFDGFRREGRVQEQQSVAREASVTERDLQQQAAADVRAALLDLESSREQVAATSERLRLAEQEVTQARERFRAGVAGNADVITALLTLTTARTSVIDAETNFQNARVALARAEGVVTTLP